MSQGDKVFGFINKNVSVIGKDELQAALREHPDGIVVLGGVDDMEHSKGMSCWHNARGMAFARGDDFVEKVFVNPKTGRRVPGDARVLLVHAEDSAEMPSHILMVLVGREAAIADKLGKVGGDLVEFALAKLKPKCVQCGLHKKR